MGVLVDEHVQATEILYYIRAMIETFCQHGNYENRAKARTRFMQETLGVDGLKEAFLENVAKMKEKGGLDLHVEAKPVTKKGSGEIVDKRVVGSLCGGIPSDRRMSSGRKTCGASFSREGDPGRGVPDRAA